MSSMNCLKGTSVEASNQPSQLLALGDSFLVDEGYDEAVSAYTASLSQSPNSVETFRILSHRSSALYYLKRYDHALQDAQNAQSSVKEEDVACLRAGEMEVCCRREGLAALALGRYDYARASFASAQQMAISNGRDFWRYQKELAQCDERQALSIETGAAASATSASSSALGHGASSLSDPTSSTRVSFAPDVAMLRKESDSLVDQMSDLDDQVLLRRDSSIPASEVPSIELCATRDNEPSSVVPEVYNELPYLSSSSSQAIPSIPKYQYYQSDKFITIQVLEKGVQQSDLTVELHANHLLVRLTKNGKRLTIICGYLYDEIKVDQSRTLIKDEKVVIKLAKQNVNYEWPELLGVTKISNDTTLPSLLSNDSSLSEAGIQALSQQLSPTESVQSDSNPSPRRPYSSNKDWNKIEKQLTQEVEEDMDPTNRLFQQIYANADEDTRRAMIKSYQTSGGTVLSTNWGEVKQTDYEKERLKEL